MRHAEGQQQGSASDVSPPAFCNPRQLVGMVLHLQVLPFPASASLVGLLRSLPARPPWFWGSGWEHSWATHTGG